jgi:flagellar basal body-associated protein FliL
MITTILVTLVVLAIGFSTYLYLSLRKTNAALKKALEKVYQAEMVDRAQNDLTQILSTGVAAFLHISLKTSLDRLDTIQNNLEESEKMNTELVKWVTDFGKLTKNVYNQLKSIDERGMFEKDDEVGFLFQDMLAIITEYNKRINSNDDSIAADEKQG